MKNLMLNVRIYYTPVNEQYMVELYTGMKYLGKTYKTASEVEKIKASGIVYNMSDWKGQ